jgi:hypothetical protein
MKERLAGGVRQAGIPLLLVGAIAALFLPLTPTYDLNVFLHAGRAALDGRQIYPTPGSPAVYSGFSFVYPYFAVWPFVPLAALPSGLSTTLYFAISVGAVLAASYIAADGDPWPPALVLCTTYTITGLQLGALSPLLFAGTVLMWRLRGRPVAFALLAAPVVASKLFLAPLLLWPLLARRYRAFAWASASTLALLAVSFAVGPLGPGAYLQLLSELGRNEAHSGFSLIGALRNGGFPLAAAQAVAAALALIVLAGAYLQHRRGHDERVLFCGALAVSLILTPVLWSHYLILVLAGMFALKSPRRWLIVLALASWAIAPPHGFNPDTDLVGGITSSGTWLAVGAALLVLGYLGRHRRERLQ